MKITEASKIVAANLLAAYEGKNGKNRMTDHIETLRQHNEWLRDKLPVTYKPEFAEAIDATIAEVERLRLIEAASRNLIAQKGRYNTEIAYNRLVEACKC